MERGLASLVSSQALAKFPLSNQKAPTQFANFVSKDEDQEGPCDLQKHKLA